MYTSLLLEKNNGIAIITINRPDKLNALNAVVMDELKTAVAEIQHDATIYSAIITGSGEKAFVAGADISEFTGLSKEHGMALAKKGQEIFFGIEHSSKPILAAVNGFALGAGCELAMACHLRIASEHAKFGQPEINLGLLPGYGGTQRLTQLIGKGRSIEMLISGKMIDAATALQYGLVNKVVPQEQLMDKTKNMLELINSKAPLAVAQSIRCVNALYEQSGNSGFDEEVRAFGACFATEDMKEGTSAFLEKRKAVFTGK